MEASEAGSVEAYAKLAQFYECGIQVKRSTTTAFRLMESTYKKEIWSGRKLAKYYALGIGAAQDEEKAAEIYKDLYEGGGVQRLPVQPLYGICLIRGIRFRKNVKKGLRLIQEGCAQNERGSWTTLGDWYGLNKNMKKALVSHKRAIEINDAAVSMVRSHYSIAEMYENGHMLLIGTAVKPSGGWEVCSKMAMG